MPKLPELDEFWKNSFGCTMSELVEQADHKSSAPEIALLSTHYRYWTSRLALLQGIQRGYNLAKQLTED